MKLEQFFNEAHSLGADRKDPLLSIVKNLNDERAHLVELRRQTQGYLMPVATKGGKTAIVSDPDLSEDVADLADQIEASKARIADLEGCIDDVDGITTKYGIERPLLRELRYELGSTKNGIIRAKEKVAGTLGHVLSFKVADEEQAKQHPEYLKAVHEYEVRKERLTPTIERLEACIAELSEAI